jgi:hypothetical protein
MCHPALVHAQCIELHPSLQDNEAVEDCFHVRVLYRDSPEWHVLPLVHIDKRMVSLFERREVVGFSVEPLGNNSLAAKALALSAQPRSVVLGVELRDGRRLSCTPAPLTRAIRQQLLIGVIGLAGGLGVAFLHQSIAAAALAGLATHFFRNAWAVPRKPAW